MMVASQETTGAVTRDRLDWDSIDWTKHEKIVNRLQSRIVKAVKEGRCGKVKALQHLLTHSFSGKVIAVERVTTNQGKNTAGVDNQLWQHNRSKERAVLNLTQRGYKPQPLRRVLIPKKNGKMRPLGIPTMKDRAMQALHLMALDPVAETTADPDSYGFRKSRSCADAIEQCFCSLARKASPQWILEGDIKACFDEIDHEWLIRKSTVPNKRILRSWLRSGYLYKNVFHNTTMGTPQGGIISPTLANIALDGLDALLAPWKKRSSNKVNYVRYADDFIITASSKELIEKEILPVVTTFFAERGLTLSTEKTIITPISEGFDFLGQTLRKFKEKLIIKPSKKSIKAILEKLRGIIDKNKATSAYELIAQLNPVIRGWCNYHKHASSKKIFDQIDTALFHSLWHWAKRRHHNKNLGWIANKYFGHLGNRNWHFFGAARLAKGEPLTKKWLFLAARTPIIRHIKIQKTMNPYDPKDAKYFATRKAKLAKRNARFSELGYGDIDNENDWFTYVPGIVTTTALSNARLRV